MSGWNPTLSHTNFTFSDDDKKANLDVGGNFAVVSDETATSGKVYFETQISYTGSPNINILYSGFSNQDFDATAGGSCGVTDAWSFAIIIGTDDAHFYNNGSSASHYGAFSSNNVWDDIFQIAFDIDSGEIWFGRNNTEWVHPDVGKSPNPSTGVDPAFTGITGTTFRGCSSLFRLDTASHIKATVDDCAYSPPSGFSYLYSSSDLVLPVGDLGYSAPEPALAYGDGVVPYSAVLNYDAPVPSIEITVHMPVGDLVYSAPGPALAYGDGVVPYAGVLNYDSNFKVAYQILFETAVLSYAGDPTTYVGSVRFMPAGELVYSAPDPEIQQYIVNLTNAFLIYKFYLNGLNGIEIPIKSFSSRVRSGMPTYLSVVIHGDEYATTIAANATGEMRIKSGWLRDGVVYQLKQIAIATLEDIATHEGHNTTSITLTGHKTVDSLPKSVNVGNISYKKVEGSKVQLRTAVPVFGLNPGDVVTDPDGLSFTVGMITYNVAAGLCSMEITSEAA